MNRKQIVPLVILLALGIGLGIGLTGCDGSKIVSFISIAPSSATVSPGGSQQFTASVRNSANPDSVSYAAALGTIDQNGLYTAAGLSSGASDTVTVTAKDGSGTTMSAAVTILSKIKIDQGAQSVSIGGRNIQFTAMIDDKSSANVDWTVVHTAGTPDAQGSITPTGLYTSALSSSNVKNGAKDTIFAKIRGTTIQTSAVVTVAAANINVPVQ